ncbi:MAG: hypothetical protein Kilf2KO_19970 [Rhodospirillales bacterium]
MATGFRIGDRAVSACLIAALLSLLFWLPVLLFGFDQAPANAPDDYETYFGQANWWPFPVFFLAMTLALGLTWRPLLLAWSHLGDSGVLLGAKGKPDAESLAAVVQAVRRKRSAAVLAALAIAVLVNAADWRPLYGVFFGKADLEAQQDFACRYPSASVKWLFAEAADRGQTLCRSDASYDRSGVSTRSEQPPLQLLYNAVLMLQQFTLVFFAALGVVQILLHTLLFALFERLAVARSRSLSLQLNCRSPLNEFGLEHWNYALNNFYWAVSPALLAVFLSRAATPPELYLPGQALLAIAVPASLMAPMIATVVVRQVRLPAAWRTLEPEGPVPPEDYRRQQLWPLDRNWSSKLGIVLAFALAALSIGFEISQLMRV